MPLVMFLQTINAIESGGYSQKFISCKGEREHQDKFTTEIVSLSADPHLFVILR